jgi:hypothetical protein
MALMMDERFARLRASWADIERINQQAGEGVNPQLLEGVRVLASDQPARTASPTREDSTDNPQAQRSQPASQLADINSESSIDHPKNQRAAVVGLLQGSPTAARDDKRAEMERRSAAWVRERNRLAALGVDADEIRRRTGPDPVDRRGTR